MSKVAVCQTIAQKSSSQDTYAVVCCAKPWLVTPPTWDRAELYKLRNQQPSGEECQILQSLRLALVSYSEALEVNQLYASSIYLSILCVV